MNLAKETIQIQGISCVACVRRVEQGLSTWKVLIALRSILPLKERLSNMTLTR